ncbi:hypothetical protein Vi05172_g13402 [Venturia inaequalis]|nr:hypothetical protein Vi05172_g13402 [Venturia inaequalis]
MQGQPRDTIPEADSERPLVPWNIPPAEDVFDHPRPLPNPGRIATIITNVTKVWGPGDWRIQTAYYFKPASYGAKCKSLVGVWNYEYDQNDPSIEPADFGPSCDGPGVSVYNRMPKSDLGSAIALSLEAAMQKLEYFSNYEKREEEEEAQIEAMRQQYEKIAGTGAITHERQSNRDRNDLLQDRLVLHWDIFGEADY